MIEGMKGKAFLSLNSSTSTSSGIFDSLGTIVIWGGI